MNKTVKWILIAVAIIAVIALIIVLILNFSKPAVTPAPGPSPAPGPGNAIQNILSQLFSSNWITNIFGGSSMAAPACQPNNPGFDNNGYYTRACGGVPGGGGANCDPDNPGKDMNGFNSSQCGG